MTGAGLSLFVNPTPVAVLPSICESTTPRCQLFFTIIPLNQTAEQSKRNYTVPKQHPRSFCEK
ncbi:hypothetical protein SAMN02744102_02663 [Paenibacillus barengoltzii]|nr:hypothetical protein SAMN02744102_02663 [Paenibacillus barengoltzii]